MNIYIHKYIYIYIYIYPEYNCERQTLQNIWKIVERLKKPKNSPLKDDHSLSDDHVQQFGASYAWPYYFAHLCLVYK